MLLEKREITENSTSKEKYIESFFDSSNIINSIYFPSKKDLFVVFRGGRTYKFVNVEEEIHDSFILAESQGKYFNSNIKNKIEYEKYFVMKDYEMEELQQKIDKLKKK